MLIALVVRTVAYEPFNIPSGSMVPTLLVGDYLFVSKFSYGYSRYSLPFGLPLFSGRIFFPFAGTRRRRGLQIADRHLDRLHQAHRRAARRPHPDEDGQPLYQRPAGAAKQIEDYMYEEGNGAIIPFKQYIEALPRGVQHRIIKSAITGRWTTRRSTSCRRATISRWATTATIRRTAGCCRPSAMSRQTIWSEGSVPLLLDRRLGALWEVWKWPIAIRYSRLFRVN